MSAVRNTLGKEQISQDMDKPQSDAVHSESGTPSGKRDLRKRLGSRRVRSVSGSPEPRRGRPESPRKKDPERKTVFKRPERVYSTGLETRRRVCLHTRMTQGVNRTIAVAEILRAVTKAPTLEEQSLLLRNTITKEHPHTGRKLCRKAKVVQEDTGSQGQKGKGQALKMTIYPSHGYARILIRSLLAFVISISQKGPVCQVMSKHMTEARIQKIISRSFRQRQKWNDGQCQHGATCSIPHLPDPPGFKIESRDVKGAPEIMRILGFMHGITNPELIKRLHDKILKLCMHMHRHENVAIAKILQRLVSRFASGDDSQIITEQLPVSVKGKILADFIVECLEEDDPDTAMDIEEELSEPFEATNNEAEYEALNAGLRIAEEMGVKNLQAIVDSRLVANQVNGTYIAKEEDMIRFPHLSKQVLVKELKENSINKLEVLAVVEEEGNTWMTPIYEYLKEGSLPAEANKARAIHEGSCSMHAGTRSVVAKALQIEYYWPTMHRDERALIKACQDYQVHRPIPRNLQQKLTPITSQWPFYKWGIDIVGPFPKGPGKVKFLIVVGLKQSQLQL
ncbi:reverse transcriptase domain-containing protein [Tanacetum coccineum]